MWVAHCDGPRGHGDPTCKRQVQCGTSAKIPPASGWTIVSNPTGEGCLILCPGCSGIHLKRQLEEPTGSSAP